MQRTRLDQVLVQQLPVSGPFVLIGMILATLLISTFMSNTAAANLILPVGVSFAASLGAASALDPVQMALCIALVASMAMGLPVSTPPNAIAYASGELTARDFSLAGGLLGVVAAVLIGALGGPIIGFWIAS
jgi:sodium-dependent dicarboxylate transporter 2/3/5